MKMVNLLTESNLPKPKDYHDFTSHVKCTFLFEH